MSCHFPFWSTSVDWNFMKRELFVKKYSNEEKRIGYKFLINFIDDLIPVAFSVTGKRCRYGARLNTDVRYWYCETEGEAGWDYCCRPQHNCGYSDGYDYPWWGDHHILVIVIDPLGRPTITVVVIIIFSHGVRMYWTYTSVPTLQTLAKQNKFRMKNIAHYCWDCGAGREDDGWHMFC